MAPELKVLHLHHLKKPRNFLAALAFSPIRPEVHLDCLCSPVFFPPGVQATVAFSSIQRRVHMSNSHPPIFSAPAVMKNISEPEKRLINGSGLLIYSVNRFHFDALPYP